MSRFDLVQDWDIEVVTLPIDKHDKSLGDGLYLAERCVNEPVLHPCFDECEMVETVPVLL